MVLELDLVGGLVFEPPLRNSHVCFLNSLVFSPNLQCFVYVCSPRAGMGPHVGEGACLSF